MSHGHGRRRHKASESSGQRGRATTQTWYDVLPRGPDMPSYYVRRRHVARRRTYEKRREERRRMRYGLPTSPFSIHSPVGHSLSVVRNVLRPSLTVERYATRIREWTDFNTWKECRKRRLRRRILFALKLERKGSGSGKRKFDENSKVRC